jgi:nitroreductase
MALFGPYLAAALLLVVAGAAKVRRPGDLGTAAPVGAVTLRALAGFELVLGLVAIVRPSTLAAAGVALSYLAFAVYVLWLRARGNPLATCGCFGAIDTAPTRAHVVVDLGLAVAAAGVAVSPVSGWLPDVLDGQPGAGWPLLLAAATIAVLAYAALSPLARVDGARRLYRVAVDE